MKTKKGALPPAYAATSLAAPVPADVVPTTISTAVSLPPNVLAPPPPVFPQVPQVPFQYPPVFSPYTINPMATYLQGFNMPRMGMAMPGMPMPMMPGVEHSSSPCKERPSSPCSSLPIACMLGGVHDFCESYGISESEELALDKLGFELGDNLGQVTEQKYEAVGFKTLAWMRVLKAYKKFKRENKN